MFVFGSKKGTAIMEAPPPEPTPPQRPQPRKVRAVGTKKELEDYFALCKDISAETPAVRMLQLRQFLAERGIPEYDGWQVHLHLIHQAKMQRKATGQNQTIFWYPLRKDDTGDQHPLWFAWDNVGDGVSIKYMETKDTIYYKLVPASALETVKMILQGFPDAKFFVSDIAELQDPFLAVNIPGQKLLIVDFWDEPGFRPITR